MSEFYRDDIRSARLVACTGCNSAAGLFPLLPLVAKNLIDPTQIIVNLAAGISGAGRSPKESILHTEISEGFAAYNVARHRHMAEFDQELSKAFMNHVVQKEVSSDQQLPSAPPLELELKPSAPNVTYKYNSELPHATLVQRVDVYNPHIPIVEAIEF